MARLESVSTVGTARSRQLRLRLGDEIGDTRRALGVSLREVGRRIGVSAQRIARAERGDPTALTIDLVARIGAVLGKQLAAALYPAGDPVRDAGHLRLIARFRKRLHPSLRWRTEVPIPIAGDPRSGDGLISGTFGDVLVEAETHLGDVQATERRVAAKARDLGADRVILLVADTRHNRGVLQLHPELRDRFPIGRRACLLALARAVDPGGDALVLL